MEPYIRKGDGLILVCQNNEEQNLTIKEVNPILCDILGRGEEELIDAPLSITLAKKLRESLDDYLEYEEDAHDMQAVLSRVNGFKLAHKDGREIDVTCKIVRSTAYDRHHWFRLIIKDEHVRREEDARRTILVENFRGHEIIDSDIGIPDAASLNKDLELVMHYVQSNSLQAIYVLVRLDDYQQLLAHDAQLATDAIKHASNTLRRCLRSDDAICRASEDSLGLILTDITMESARVVLNRLRWSVVSDRLVSKGSPSRSLNISIAYKNITGDEGDQPITRCQEALDNITTPNAMLEL